MERRALRSGGENAMYGQNDKSKKNTENERRFEALYGKYPTRLELEQFLEHQPLSIVREKITHETN